MQIYCWIATLATGKLWFKSPLLWVMGFFYVFIIGGLTLTLLTHWIVQVCHLKPYLGPAPLIYSCLTIIFTFATWILFYQN